MKRKTTLLSISILLLSGCSVQCNIDIDDKITETTTIKSQEEGIYTKEYMKSLYEEEYPIYEDEEFLYYKPDEKIKGNTYYEKTLKEQDNGYIATYKAEYSKYDYYRSRFLTSAFQYYNVGYDTKDKVFYIVASNAKIFKSNNTITDLTININLKDYEIVESNADSINNNKLTWRINKNNSSNAKINLKYKEKDNAKENPEDKKKKKDYTFYIFMGIIILTILIVFKIFKNMKNKEEFDD